MAKASKHYNKAADMWAAIAYWPEEELEHESHKEECRVYLRKWEKKVQGWTKKAKGLAQFQRVGK